MRPRFITTVAALAVLTIVASACSSGDDTKSSVGVSDTRGANSSATSTTANPVVAATTSLTLDPKHDHGNKYAR